MMEKLFWVFLVGALVGACGGDDSSSGGTGGSGTGGTGGSGTGGSGTGGSGIGGSGIGGSGGSSTGGAAGSAGTSGAGGSADAGQCAALFEPYQAALAEAVKCSPQLSVVQCSGTATLYDSCGCKVLANETKTGAVNAAKSAYDFWVKAGCGPYPCGKACFEGTTGACDPTSGTCVWK